MHQGENAPPLHARCRCTIVATDDAPKGKRAARSDDGKRSRVPADMSYRDWRAVYIDKTKSLAQWQSEVAEKRAAALPVEPSSGKVVGGNDITEMHRRRQAQDGHEIIDKPTYNKLTRSFLNSGGLIIRGEEATRHLASSGAYASYFVGANVAFIADDATVSDVLEEMYHAYQDRAKMFGEITDMKVVYKREIDAQKYLLNSAKKYKIPPEETAVTLKKLELYEKLLAKMLKNGDENG